MNQYVFQYLKKNCSTKPEEVDRLIISAFISTNKIRVKNNVLLQKYIIKETQKAEFDKLTNFLKITKSKIPTFDIEALIELFEFVISPADRKVNGAIYTPKYIRDFIINKTFIDQTNNLYRARIADIACGCGGFLVDAAKKIKKKSKKSYYKIFKSQIFGLDVQSYSIVRTKLLLTCMAVSEGEDKKSFTFNLYTGDALNFNWAKKIKKFKGFEIIIGNPPYVCSRNISEATKKHIPKWEVCNSGHPDLYIPFFQIGAESLAPSGILSYITMNSFIKSLNGRALREYLKKNQTSLKLIDFGTEQVFKAKNTYTCICFIKNEKSNAVEYIKLNSKSLDSIGSYNQIDYETLDSNKGWNLQQNKIISLIESTGVPFGKVFKTRNGIATLKNDIFIFKPISEDRRYYYLQNGEEYPIEKGICRDILNSNKLSVVENINELTEKVIFPYDDQDKPKLLSENYLRTNFPRAHTYLTHKKDILAKRDKGKRKYEKWFAYGRTQSLERTSHKLFFPQITNKIPNFIMNSDNNLLFYNGLALIGESIDQMKFVQKLMSTRLFWYYITHSSKPYGSDYYALSSNYIKNFGVCKLTEDEIEFVITTDDQQMIDDFIESKYGVSFN